MTREEHKQILDTLLNADSQADRSELLSKLESDYVSVLGERDTALTERDALKTDNEKFAKINNELFLQVGATQKRDNDETGTSGQDDEPPAKLSYDDLKFD